MAFCTKCGQSIRDDAAFCPSCGQAVQAAQQAQQQTSPPPQGQPGGPGFQSSTPPPQGPQGYQGPGGQNVQNILNTADSTDQFNPQDIEQNKVMGILAYLGILVLIPIFAAKESPFARYHANQGLNLALLALGVWVISWILLRISWALAIIFNLVYILILVLAIIGIINVVNGRARELPLIGRFRLLN